MSAEPNFLDVKIMGREYRVACTPEELDGLLAAGELVDNKMREIAQRTKSTIAERVAVMAALNIAHESLQARTELKQVTNIYQPRRPVQKKKSTMRLILPTRSVESSKWEHGSIPRLRPNSNWICSCC